MRKNFFSLAALMLTNYACAEILPQDNQSIIFMGDEITAVAAESPSGFVQLAVAGLRANNINVSWQSSGVPGDTTRKMLTRLTRDVITRQPQFLVLFCGVNEVIEPDESGSLDNFRKQLQTIADLTQKNNIQLVLLTPITAGNEKNNVKISRYAEIIRAVAKEKNIIVADTERAVRHLIDDVNSAILDGRGRKTTTDGIRLAPVGNQVVARELLRALGLNNAELTQAEVAWNQIPDAIEISANIVIPVEYQEQLAIVAQNDNLTLEQLYSQLLDNGLKVLNGLPKDSATSPIVKKLPSVAKIVSSPEKSADKVDNDPTGNLALTKELMIAGGYTPEQLTAAMNDWMGGDASNQAHGVLKIPLSRYNQILARAKQCNTSVQAYQEAALRAGINEKLKNQ
ncbi:MAG: GDSL-type esterase/lipase family protein [Lentisphaeria bacterium]|nr:GDSL-type esterase/lipase family protein [Lentisphaeria bacterium]